MMEEKGKMGIFGTNLTRWLEILGARRGCEMGGVSLFLCLSLE